MPSVVGDGGLECHSKYLHSTIASSKVSRPKIEELPIGKEWKLKWYHPSIEDGHCACTV